MGSLYKDCWKEISPTLLSPTRKCLINRIIAEVQALILRNFKYVQFRPLRHSDIQIIFR